MEAIEIELLAEKIAEKIKPPGRWMSTSQAIEYSRIGKNRLKKLASEGKISGYQDVDNGRGDWIFDRCSIDKYRLSPLEASRSKKKQIIAKFKGLI